MVSRDEGALEARSVSFAYGASPVVHQVSLRLARGDLLALVGPNGSGKTTLLKLLSGILAPASGTVALDGEDMRHLSQRRRAKTIAVVPQHVEPRLAFRVEEVV